MALDLARTHPGVVVHFRVGMETGLLFFLGALDAFADRGGAVVGCWAKLETGACRNC
jgi:hypothetical protein